MREQQDPLLALVLNKLNGIERSINQLTDQIKIQNGRITKLEQAEAQEQAVTEAIEKDIELFEAAGERRYRRVIAALAVLAAFVGSGLAVIIEKVLTNG
jgi:hypothetical protein